MHKILLCRHWYYKYFYYYVLHSTIFIINFASSIGKSINGKRAPSTLIPPDTTPKLY